MSRGLSLLTIALRPAHVVAEGDFAPWFATIANHLLNRTDFIVAGRHYRLAEVEMYYSSPAHPDPFPHHDPRQRAWGRWYFHRRHGRYRSGSFQGLDLTLGDGTAYFGILIRTIITPEGTAIVGPSRTVDHLLAATQTASVAELDHRIAARPIADPTSPLHLADAPAPRPTPVYATARVGLSLKRAQEHATRFVGRPYRYLTEPAVITKGKVPLALALHCEGYTPAEIHALTGISQRALARYLTLFATGQQSADFNDYCGQPLTTATLCQLLGTWHTHYGSERTRQS